MQSADDKVAELRFLERYGLKYLRRWNARARWAVHHVTAAEARDIRRTGRLAVVWASLAGVVSGAIIGGTELVVSQRGAQELELLLWREQWRQWGWFLAISIVVSGAEILFLYWNGIRAAGRISAIAGLRVARYDIASVVPTGLARAALELPDPREPIHGIDPFARTPRWKLALMALLYRLKVGATSFLLRILLRRILGRAALRFLIPFVAMPVYAVWNAVITAWVLRQVRIRSFGPAAVEDALGRALADPGELSPQARRVIVSGVGEMIIRNADAHPNFVLLVGRLLRDLGPSHASVRVDWEADRHLLATLEDRERETALAIFAAAAVLDGRLRPGELRFLDEAHRLSGSPFAEHALRRLRDDFLHGRGL